MREPVENKEATLVALARAGDRQALEALVERYYAALRAVLVRYGGVRQDEVEDVVQETFLRALAALDRYQDRGHFRTWLYRIAVNLARDKRKREGRVVTGVDVSALADVPDFGSDPALTTLGRLEREALAAALNRLPESQREALVLRFYAELPLEDVARVVGCPEGTVKSRIHYALRKLRGLLAVEYRSAGSAVEGAASGHALGRAAREREEGGSYGR